MNKEFSESEYKMLTHFIDGCNGEYQHLRDINKLREYVDEYLLDDDDEEFCKFFSSQETLEHLCNVFMLLVIARDNYDEHDLQMCGYREEIDELLQGKILSATN